MGSEMCIRDSSLGYLSPNQYSYLMRQMSMNGYRQKEPLDDTVEYKHPVAFKQAITLLLTTGNMSSGEIMNIFSSKKFSISPELVEDLLNLDPGTLSKRHVEDNILVFPQHST